MVSYVAATPLDTDQGRVAPGDEVDITGWEDERIGRLLRTGAIHPYVAPTLEALPIGPAGGALAGVYPEPNLRAQSVGDIHIDPSQPIGRDRIAAVEPVLEVGTRGRPTFHGTFTNYGHGFENVGFWLDSLTNLVHLRGLASNTGTDTEIFTLPSGYRPITGHLVVPVAGHDDGIPVSKVLTIHSTGSVVVGQHGPHGSVSLAGVCFRVGDR